jgi:hypothetical protein
MAAGVTGKLWEISDVVAMLEKWEAAEAAQGNSVPDALQIHHIPRPRFRSFCALGLAKWPSRLGHCDVDRGFHSMTACSLATKQAQYQSRALIMFLFQTDPLPALDRTIMAIIPLLTD